MEETPRYGAVFHKTFYELIVIPDAQITHIPHVKKVIAVNTVAIIPITNPAVVTPVFSLFPATIDKIKPTIDIGNPATAKNGTPKPTNALTKPTNVRTKPAMPMLVPPCKKFKTNNSTKFARFELL